jgi:hypothetical protein
MSQNPHDRSIILADGFRLTQAQSLLGMRRWTSRWSDGGNIPFGLALPKDHYFAKCNLHFYPKGLWVFAANFLAGQIDDLDERNAGMTVDAITAAHAIYLLRKQIKP